MPTSPTAKIKTLPELKELTLRARSAGKKIVLANGCFDLIHVGHIRYLQDARARGDMLLLAINSDASVGILKGAGRPLQSEQERAEILASLECVDYVIVFDDMTVDRLLLSLQPDVHVKGTDYTSQSVPERATVLSYGGSVEIVGDPKRHSTRDLIAEIVAKTRS